MAFFSIVGNEAQYTGYDNTDTGIEATSVQDAIDEILTGTVLSAQNVFYNANQGQVYSYEVQSGLDTALFRTNRFPIIAGTWDGGTVALTSPDAPLAEDGVEGDYWVAGEFGGAIWPPVLYGPKDAMDNWPEIGVLGATSRLLVASPTQDTPPIPEFAYTNGDEVTVYRATITTIPNDGDYLRFNGMSQLWETALIATSETTYDNTASGLTATNTQEAVDEIADIVDNLAAPDISYDNATSGLAATETKAAIDELADEKVDFTVALNNQTGTSYELAIGDRKKIVTLSNTSAITLTVPASTFAIGAKIDLIQLNTGQVTVQGAGGVTVSTAQTLKLRARYSAASLVCVATNVWVLIGDLEA